MAAHQIIYTSCRRGIEGMSDGLQVFSYDRGLRNEPVDLGTGYANLFPSPDPKEIGVPALGYKLFDDEHALFTYNTKLRFDYKGPEGRGGNVLRQSILVRLDDLSYRPILIHGNPALMSSVGSEVTSEEQPEYLDEFELAFPAKLTVDAVAGWLGEGERLDVLPNLVARFFEAKQASRMLVIVDEPENVDKWIAAIEYTLPTRLAKEVSFLDACDQVGMAGGDITGTTATALSNVPDYALANCDVFDPGALIEGDGFGVAEGYLSFIGMAYSMRPAQLISFADFVGNSTDIGFSIGLFESAFALWSILESPSIGSDPDTLFMALPFAEMHASENVNAQLSSRLLGSLDALTDRGLEALVAALGYLLRHIDKLSEGQAVNVGDMAAATASRLLSDPKVSPSEFPANYIEISDSCAKANLDLLALLRERGYAESMFAEGEVSDPAKIEVVCRIAAEDAMRRGVDARELLKGMTGNFLYNALVRAFSAGLSYGSSAMTAAGEPFGHRIDLLLSLIDLGLCAIQGAGASDPNGVEAVWEPMLSLYPIDDPSTTAETISWLSHRGRHADAITVFGDATKKCATSRGVVKLFQELGRTEAFSSQEFIEKVYPAVTQIYVNELMKKSDEDAKTALLAYVSSLADSAAASFFDASIYDAFMPEVAAFLTREISPIALNGQEREVLHILMRYSTATGRQLLSGRASLAAAKILLDSAVNSGNRDVLTMFPSPAGKLDLTVLGGRERLLYVNDLIQHCLDAATNAGDVKIIADALQCSRRDRVEIAARLAKAAKKRSKTRHGSWEPLAIIIVWSACFADQDAMMAVTNSIGHLHDEDIQYLQVLIQRQITSGVLKRYGLHDERAALGRVKQMLNRMRGSNNGLLRRIGLR